MAATMRSLTSPVIAPLYSPTQARSDCSASRSPCAMALAVSVGVCIAGRWIGTVATDFGLVFACTDVPAAANIKVAVSHNLMTNPDRRLIGGKFKHISLVGNSRAGVHEEGLETTGMPVIRH